MLYCENHTFRLPVFCYEREKGVKEKYFRDGSKYITFGLATTLSLTAFQTGYSRGF
jgi:hypothetical protein